MTLKTGSTLPRESRCESEQDRIRDLARFYCTFEHDPQPPSSVRLSPDHTLTALTQLGVYRFGCNRSFVSIIDGENQHLIAEATASVSLHNKDHHLPDDGIYLGVRTLDLEWGVCPHAIRLFTGQDSSRVTETENITANRTRNIIRDFTLEDFYKNRPYVLDWPYFRFYAEVPLYSPSGYVLGSYCIVDNKTRAGFGDEEVAALQEIADAIAQHLENVRIAHYHHRAENLVKGLTSFVEGHIESDSPDPFDTPAASPKTLSFPHGNSPRDNGHLQESDTSLPATESLSTMSTLDRSSSAAHDDKTSSLFSEAEGSKMTQPTTQPSSLVPGSPESTELIGSDDQFFSDLAVDEVPMSERVAAIFSRASDLLRASMDLDGVVFLDARPGDSQFNLDDDLGYREPISNSRDSNSAMCQLLLNLSDSTEKPSEITERLCSSLGQSLSVPPTELPGSRSQLSMSEDFLHKLIKYFPRGHIFNMNEPQCETETIQEMFCLLANHLPDAKFILFIPLWDWNKSHWLAGTLVWTRASRRPLGMEELHYFKAFGDSIISEVSRIHWTAAERSKFDFVSSINHELRSPLHGILGSTELLLSTTLQPTQHELVKMVATSGLTLLDTIDHMLQFTKISDLATTRNVDRNAIETGTIGLVSDFDLGALVEDVATVLFTGRSSGSFTSLTNTSLNSASGPKTVHGLPRSCDAISMVIQVEQSHSWMVRSAAGAWKRILMNLLGNAVKWTKTGLVEVTLSKARPETNYSSSFAHLCVRDTGSGISRDYLKNLLFSPFAKEDSLSEGVGLGLCIVRKLVKSLDGAIGVRSEVDIGTKVDIYIPLKTPKIPRSVQLVDPHTSVPVPHSPPIPIRAHLIGFNASPNLKETPTGILTVDAKRKLSIQSALHEVFQIQLGWQISLANDFEDLCGDVAIIEETTLPRMLNDAQLHAADFKQNFRFLIVLNDKTSTLTDHYPANIIRVSQPFGPKSLNDAAQRLMEIYKAPLQPGAISSFSTSHQQTLPLSAQQGPPSISKISLSGCSFAAVNFLSQPEIIVHQTESQQKSLHVLIVDDNDINLKIMSTFMRKLGCHYETASNGLIALEKYGSANQQYDFVLMDISMPIMDGLTATTKIREHERDKGLHPSRIVAITAVASNTTQEAALESGVDDYLVKPLSLGKLRELMHVL